MDYKIILGIISIILALVSFLPYLFNLLKNKTKPHVFSWFIWGLLMITGFFAQISRGGGSGAWITFVASILSFAIFFIAFFKYKIDYLQKIDWFCFFGALFGIFLWILTRNPLMAVIIITLTDAIAFIPTFRKAYNKPYEETTFLYLLSAFSWFFGLLALQSFNLTTVLYPASLVLTNSLFVTFLMLRRLKIKSTDISAD